MSHFRNRLDRRKCLRSTRGAAAIELALLAPILLLFLVAVVDFGLWIREQMLLTSAARAGAQFVLQDPETNATDKDGIASAVTGASGLDAAKITIVPKVFCECANGTAKVCTDLCGSDQPRKYVAVTVTEGQFKTLFPYPGIPDPISISGTTTVRLE